MESEIINVLDSVKTPVINETIKLPADKCASCNENESGKAGSSQGTCAGHVGLRLTPLWNSFWKASLLVPLQNNYPLGALDDVAEVGPISAFLLPRFNGILISTNPCYIRLSFMQVSTTW